MGDATGAGLPPVVHPLDLPNDILGRDARGAAASPASRLRRIELADSVERAGGQSNRRPRRWTATLQVIQTMQSDAVVNPGDDFHTPDGALLNKINARLRARACASADQTNQFLAEHARAAARRQHAASATPRRRS